MEVNTDGVGLGLFDETTAVLVTECESFLEEFDGFFSGKLDVHSKDMFLKLIITLKTEIEEVLELNIDLEKFKRMSLVEKDIEYQNILHVLYYKKLISLNSEKKIYKDEINALKSLYDLISVNNIDVSKLTFANNSEDIEKKGIELIRLVLSKQLISEKVAINISELLFKDFKKIENIEKDNVDVFEYMTEDEIIQIRLLTDKSNERSKNFTPMEWGNERCRLYQEEQSRKENIELQNN